LLRLLGTLGDDGAVQAQAGAVYARFLQDPVAVDANVAAAAITILAHAGDAARYDEFLRRFHSAQTPQEEQRYLYALTTFRPPELVEQTLIRTLNGEIRTQDAPLVIRALLMSVHGRALAWEFVKANWEQMNRDYPVVGLRRMCEGVIGLATPEWEQDAHKFFTSRKVDLGGKTLPQYLEQLHVAVALREREGTALRGCLQRQ